MAEVLKQKNVRRRSGLGPAARKNYLLVVFRLPRLKKESAVFRLFVMDPSEPCHWADTAASHNAAHTGRRSQYNRCAAERTTPLPAAAVFRHGVSGLSIKPKK